MDSIKHAIDFVLHVDKHLLHLVATYGTWTYGILFAIVFCETGLVVTPFLPGDSLLFAAGALASPHSPRHSRCSHGAGFGERSWRSTAAASRATPRPVRWRARGR